MQFVQYLLIISRTRHKAHFALWLYYPIQYATTQCRRFQALVLRCWTALYGTRCRLIQLLLTNIRKKRKPFLRAFFQIDKISKFCGNLQLFHWHLLPLFFWDCPPNSFGDMTRGSKAPSIPMAVPHITAPGQNRGFVAVHNFQPSAISIHFNQLAVVTNVFDGHSYIPFCPIGLSVSFTVITLYAFSAQKSI